MFLKVSLWKKILRFGRKEKLSPRFIDPCEILERVGPIAYRLALPLKLAKLHDVFHVSMLWRYRSNTSHILPIQDIQVQEDFSFDEEPKAILDHEIRQLRNKQVPLVKVFWQHHGMEEATWELESTMRVQYSQPFSSCNFEDEIYFKGGRIVTPQNTTYSFLNIIRVYFKCILKFFVIIILLSEKISKPEICTRYKGKSGICQNMI